MPDNSFVTTAKELGTALAIAVLESDYAKQTSVLRKHAREKSSLKSHQIPDLINMYTAAFTQGLIFGAESYNLAHAEENVEKVQMWASSLADMSKKAQEAGKKSAKDLLASRSDRPAFHRALAAQNAAREEFKGPGWVEFTFGFNSVLIDYIDHHSKHDGRSTTEVKEGLEVDGIRMLPDE